MLGQDRKNCQFEEEGDNWILSVVIIYLLKPN